MPLFEEFFNILKGVPKDKGGGLVKDLLPPKTWTPQQHWQFGEFDEDFARLHNLPPPAPGVTRVVVPKPAAQPALPMQPSAAQPPGAVPPGPKVQFGGPTAQPAGGMYATPGSTLSQTDQNIYKGLGAYAKGVFAKHINEGKTPVQALAKALVEDTQGGGGPLPAQSLTATSKKKPVGAYPTGTSPQPKPVELLPAVLPPKEREAARLAGKYTTPAFRGDATIGFSDKTVKSKTSLSTGPQSGGKTYLTDNPKIANLYASHTNNINDPHIAEGAVIQPVWIDTSDFHVFDAKGGQMLHVYNTAKQAAIKAGKKGVIYKNVQDAPSLGSITTPSTVYVAFPGHNTIKSKFAAKFDPKDPRWLAGIAGIGVVGAAGGGMLSSEAQASPADLPKVIRAWHAGSPNIPLGRGTLDLTRAGSGESELTRTGRHPLGREMPAGTERSGLQQGHAAYVAEHEGVADYYRDLLTSVGKPAAKYGGKLTVDPQRWIDFDKPFEQQSKFVRDAILKVYGSPQDMVRPSREKTEQLKQLGVHGVRYLDALSREGRGKTRNYALFNPKLMDLTDKYGLAALIGGGASAAALMPGRAQAGGLVDDTMKGPPEHIGGGLVNEVLGTHGFRASASSGLVNEVLGAPEQTRSYLSRFRDIPGDIADVFKEGVGEMTRSAKSIHETGEFSFGRAAPQRHDTVAGHFDPERGGAQLQAMQDFMGIVGGAVQAAGSWAMGPFRSLASRPLEEAGGPRKETTEMVAGLALPVFPKLKGIPTPKRPSGVVQSESDNLFRLRQSVTADRGAAMEWIKQIPDQWKDAATQERWYHAIEEGTVGGLPAQEQQAIATYLEPIRDKLHSLHAYITQHDPNLGYLTDPTYIHRIAKTHAPNYDLPGTGADPVTGVGGTLPRTTSALQGRRFLAIVDPATGQRTVITPGEGEFTAWHGKVSTHGIKTGDEIKAGETINVGGRKFDVVQATTREIEQHGMFADNVPAAYHKNAMVNTMDAWARLNQVARDIDYLENLKKSPEWAVRATTNKQKAYSNGWKQSKLPQLEGWYIEPKLREAFDDFYRPGVSDSEFWQSVQKVNQFATTSMFWNPTPHIENVAGHWFVGRGWDWLRPSGYASVLRDGLRAAHAVTTQNKDYRDLLREGSGLVFGGVANRDFYRAMAKRMGMEIEKDPQRWGPIVRRMGLNKPADMTALLYEGSRRALWWFNDLFMLQRVFELERRGFSRAAAIKEAEKHIPNYRIPTQILGSRAFAQVMGDPALTMFGRYHYGMWNSFSHMAKDLVRGGGQEKFEALGNLMALFALSAVIYPMISNGIKRLTGDPDAEKIARGPAAIPGSFADLYQNGDIARFVSSVVTMAPGVKQLGEDVTNRDWFTGRQIAEPEDFRQAVRGSPRAAARVVGQEAEHAAGAVAPYALASQATQPGGRGMGRALVDQVLGARNVSERTQRGKSRAEKAQRRASRLRAKRPRGLIERGIYESTD